nr:fasciclin domain-containing protein [Acidobacteriota bacterium]
EVLAADVVNLTSATTLQGDDVTITVTDAGVMINDSNVITTDVIASNGVIHVIDAVLLPPEEPQDIVDTAIAAGSFNTLVAAVQAAGLEDALRGDGPLTVFAPTDDAFAALPEGTLEALLADPDALAEVLLYHVVAGQVLAADVVNLTSATTLQGDDVTITVTDDGVMINDSNVVTTDVLASNGVIHVIDAVLLPPEVPDIVDTAIGAGTFNTLVAAIQAAGLEDALRGDGPFTVFAPTDDAFAALPDGTLEALLADPEGLAEILLYHVVGDALTAADVLSRNQVATLQGTRAAITSTDAGAFIDDARITATDITASNGIIHVIDAVILPEAVTGRTYEVIVTNITKGQVYSPPLLVSHTYRVKPFELGGVASPGLKLMAEDGDASLLLDELFPSNDVLDLQIGDAPIGPGESVTYNLQASGRYNMVSVLGMFVSTNDTFFSATAEAPRDITELFKRASLTCPVNSATGNAYDAGTEYNSESCADIPGPPCGNPGVSPDEAGEGYIYISNGVHGKGDLDASTYDFNNPAVLVKVRLNKGCL